MKQVSTEQWSHDVLNARLSAKPVLAGHAGGLKLHE